MYVELEGNIPASLSLVNPYLHYPSEKGTIAVRYVTRHLVTKRAVITKRAATGSSNHSVHYEFQSHPISAERCLPIAN